MGLLVQPSGGWSASHPGSTGEDDVDHLFERLIRATGMPEQHSILRATKDKVAKQLQVCAGLQFTALERAFEHDERIAVIIFELRFDHGADLPAQLAGKLHPCKAQHCGSLANIAKLTEIVDQVRSQRSQIGHRASSRTAREGGQRQRFWIGPAPVNRRLVDPGPFRNIFDRQLVVSNQGNFGKCCIEHLGYEGRAALFGCCKLVHVANLQTRPPACNCVGDI